MSARWVAAAVRSRGLLQRRLGEEGALRAGAATSLDAAIASLAPTHYGPALRPEMDLALAQHAVSATVLFDLRVLAGWSPPLGAGALRALAGRFEIDNVLALFGSFAGIDVPTPYELGSLATVSSVLGAARSPAEVRSSLAASSWGDPGTDDPDGIGLALELRWARRVIEQAEVATTWARARAAIALGRVLEDGELDALSSAAQGDARRVLGPDWRRAGGLEELLELSRVGLPHAAGMFGGAAGPWRAEVASWTLLEQQGSTRRPVPDASAPVQVAQLLLLDAWRTRAALVLAERGGGDLRGELNELA